MKKLLSILLALLLLCACQNTGPEIEPSGPSGPSENPPAQQTQTEEAAETEPSVWKIGEKEYEVDVPEKTVLTDNGNGYYQVDSPSLSENPQVLDFTGLSGCEDIKELYVYANADAESILVPKMPNLEALHIFGTNAGTVDISETEGIETIHLSISPEELKIGMGPKELSLDYNFDLSKLAGAKNIKSITVYGDNDLSLIADIGEVEKIYIIGDETNLGELENLKSLKRLSVYAMEVDFSPIENLTVESLVLGDITSKAFADSFTYSETIKELQLDDEYGNDASFIEKMPNLEKILLSVASIQDASIVFMEEPITEEMLSLLETNLAKESLKAFMEKGGEIYLFADWTR